MSDSDLFGEIDGTQNGWELARRAVDRAGGGATAVLRLDDSSGHRKWLANMEAAGFDCHLVASEAELVEFARAFARKTFHLEGGLS